MTKSPRNSNLEFYRIICMSLIVCHHYVVNSGLMNVMQENLMSTPSLFYYLFGMWGKTGINGFLYPLYAIGCCVAIYVLCTLIDILRAKWIEPLYLKPFNKK